jgi:hypothetical protein
MLRALRPLSISILRCAAERAPAPLRSYAVVPGRTRKAIRKANAAAQRSLLQFARSFDPMRTARVQLSQTLRYLGWDTFPAETVGEGLVVDFTLLEWFVAFDVVPGAAFVLPGAPGASDDRGWGPGVVPELNPPPVLGRARTLPLPCARGELAPPVAGGAGAGGAPPPPRAAGRVTTPAETLFTSAPPSWLDPVRGLVLDGATASRHAAIRARGWKLVVIPEPLWSFAATKTRNAHYARRDLLLSRVLPIAPFQERPVEAVNRLRLRINEKTKPVHAAERAAAQIHVEKEKTAALMERLRVEGAGGGGGGDAGGGAGPAVAAAAAAAAATAQGAPVFKQALTMARYVKTETRKSRESGRKKEADSEAHSAR